MNHGSVRDLHPLDIMYSPQLTLPHPKEDPSDLEPHIIVEFRLIGSRRPEVWPVAALTEKYLEMLRDPDQNSRLFFPGCPDKG